MTKTKTIRFTSDIRKMLERKILGGAKELRQKLKAAAQEAQEADKQLEMKSIPEIIRKAAEDPAALGFIQHSSISRYRYPDGEGETTFTETVRVPYSHGHNATEARRDVRRGPEGDALREASARHEALLKEWDELRSKVQRTLAGCRNSNDFRVAFPGLEHLLPQPDTPVSNLPADPSLMQKLRGAGLAVGVKEGV